MPIFQVWQDGLVISLRSLLKTRIVKKIRLNARRIAMGYDFFSIVIAWFLSSWILIDAIEATSMVVYWNMAIVNLVYILPAQFILFYCYGLSRGFWRFASTQDLRKILLVSILGGVIAWLTFLNQDTALLPNTISILYSVFLIILLSVPRLCVRLLKDYKNHDRDSLRVIIVGAGNAGEGLVRDLLRDNTHRYKPIALVDDDLRKVGREIHNIKVVGTIIDLPALIPRYDIDLVLIAIPSASSVSMRSVVGICERVNIPCYTLPGIKDLANGHVSINKLRSISLEDLIGRYPVTHEWGAVVSRLAKKTILVTGGGGSIGSELCRQIVTLSQDTHIVIVDSCEFNLYSIEMELREKFSHYLLHPVLLNITDRLGIQAVFKHYKPHMVFHAAAYKHVPLLERQVRVAMHNNIIGTQILAEEAAKFGVEKFVLISSDKAVNPTNIMGASKRAAEYICQHLNDEVKTQYVIVRFGNVLDSAGSVVPLFKKQIEAGGPVTVTHPDIVRFFMTIPEASQLILQAAMLGEGGEIFVLDMGDPIKINYLAEQMIKLANKLPEHDIEIIYTGLRPGEKLYEECFYTNEILQETSHPKILRAQSPRRDLREVKGYCYEIEMLCQAVHIKEAQFVQVLKKLVPEYQSAVFGGLDLTSSNHISWSSIL